MLTQICEVELPRKYSHLRFEIDINVELINSVIKLLIKVLYF